MNMKNALREWVYAFLAVAVLFLLFGLMTGCAEMSAVRAGVATHGGQAMDQALGDAKWVTCNAASIGALERELGGDPERIAGWVLFCGKKANASPMMAIPRGDAPVAAPQSGMPINKSQKRL